MAVPIATLYGNMPVSALALSLLERTKTKTHHTCPLSVSGLPVIPGGQSVLAQIYINLPNILPTKYGPKTCKLPCERSLRVFESHRPSALIQSSYQQNCNTQCPISEDFLFVTERSKPSIRPPMPGAALLIQQAPRVARSAEVTPSDHAMVDLQEQIQNHGLIREVMLHNILGSTEAAVVFTTGVSLKRGDCSVWVCSGDCCCYGSLACKSFDETATTDVCVRKNTSLTKFVAKDVLLHTKSGVP